MNEDRAPIDTPNPRQQLDPSGKDYAHYRLFDADNRLLAEIISTRTDDRETGSGMVKETEYWRIHVTSLHLDGYRKLTLTKTPSHWIDRDGFSPPFTAADASIVCSEWPDWTPAPLPAVPCLQSEAGDGIVASLDWTQSGGWKGDLIWVRGPRDGNELLFQEGAQLVLGTPLPGSSVSPTLYRSAEGPPLHYGAALLLQGPEDDSGKPAYLSSAYSGTEWYWAQWNDDRAKAVAHVFAPVTNQDSLVRHGDTLQIVSSERLKGAANRLSELEGRTDMVYAAGDGGLPQVWTIQKDGASTGDIISFGDSGIKLYNGRLPERCLSAEKNTYLAVWADPPPDSSLGIAWTIDEPSQTAGNTARS